VLNIGRICLNVNEMGAQSAGTRKPEASVAASFSLRVFDRGAVPRQEKDRSLKAAAIDMGSAADY
jgi:hypothetical protein